MQAKFLGPFLILVTFCFTGPDVAGQCSSGVCNADSHKLEYRTILKDFRKLRDRECTPEGRKTVSYGRDDRSMKDGGCYSIWDVIDRNPHLRNG
jgi:hypothetical protein